MEDNTEELLFNLACVDESRKLLFGEWIYYINSSDISEEGDDAIWKIKKDGTENQRVQKSNTKIFYLIDVDEHWVYFVGKTVDLRKVRGLSDVIRAVSCIHGGKRMKMTIRGGLEQLMSNADERRLEKQLLRSEEN